MRRIPVSAPALAGNELKYVQDCLESSWISSTGEYIGRFERSFADFCQAKHAVACSNGTAALHLAIMALGIGPGDEVLMPTLTYVATANAVAYCGASPVFVDVDPGTWNIDVESLESHITAKTKGIIVVHLYGHPVDMDAVVQVAERHGLFIVEDAAEAHGAEYKGRRTGTLGHIATFSFYGNKIVTTGEGGMVVTNDQTLADKARLLKGQGMDPERRYWFPVLGYNYRLTNIAAAIGLAQMEKIDWHISQRRRIAGEYQERLGSHEKVAFQEQKPWAKSAHWLPSIVLKEACKHSQAHVMKKLSDVGIETRPFFVPMHRLPMYQNVSRARYPVADWLADRGINLPAFAGLASDDVNYVCEQLNAVL